MSDDAVWQALGLTAFEAATYRQLLDEPGAPPTAYATALGCTETDLEHALTRLDDLGLVLVRAGHVVVHPPAAALATLAARRRRVLDGVDEVASLLDRIYDAGRAQATSGALVEVVRGGPDILARLRDLVSGARSSMLLIDSPPYVGNPDPVLHDEETAAADRGVVIRTLVDFTAVDDPAHLRDLTRSVDEGQQVRLATNLRLKMIVVDGRRALVPLAVDPAVGRPQAAIVSHPELVAPLELLFELIFEQAFPLTDVIGGEPGELRPDREDAIDTMLLRLLATGANDIAMARKLDISERTLRRRITRLQERYGARSRFQLGVMRERERGQQRDHGVTHD